MCHIAGDISTYTSPVVQAAQKAPDAAMRRRQLASSVASVAASPSTGMLDGTSKGSRPPTTPGTVNTDTPSCKTPAPKHAKSLEV